MEVSASQPSSKTEELQMPEEGRFAPTGSRSFNFRNPGEGSPAGDPHSNARLLQDDRRLAFNRQSSFKQTSSASPISIIPNVSSKPYLARSLSSNNSFNQQLHRPSLFSPRLLDPSRQSFAEEGQYWKGNVERVEKVCPRSRLSRHESFPHSESFIGMFMAAFDIIISGSRPMKRLCTLIMLNVAYSTIELLLGLLTGRVGLVSDAFHLSFGCGVLSFSLIAMVVAKKKPDDVFTYGYKRVEVLSAFTNALFLLFLSFSLAVEALHAFVQDESEHKHYLIVSAVANLLVNVLGVWFFRGYARVQIVYRKAEDMNHHSICLHVLSDSIRSAGLILASWLLTLGVKNAEMLCLSLVSAIVFIMVLPLFKATGGILLQTAPSGVSSSAFNKCLRQVNAIEDVSEVSQVRFWELVPGYLVGQMLLQIKKGCDEYRILKHIHSLYSDIGVKDLTVQTEFV